MTFYADMQAAASEILADYEQGAITYTAPGATSGDPWNPSEAAGTSYTLDAVAKGVESRYVDGTYVLASDTQVTAAVFGAEPSPDGSLSIDGRERQIVRVEQIPAAGTAVAWRIFCRS